MIITVTSQKGGVGKTTTATTLAAGLAAMSGDYTQGDKGTLLVDFDPQGHSAIALGLDPEPGVFGWLMGTEPIRDLIRSTGRQGLILLPGNSRTNTVANVMYAEHKTLGEIADTVDYLALDYSYVVFDTPAAGILQEAAISCADVVIIPVHCESLGMDGVAATMNAIKRIAQREPQVLIVPTSYDTRLNEHSFNLGLLRDAYPSQIARPVLQRVAVAECHAQGKTVYECNSVGARDVAMAYDEVISKITEGV